MTIANNFLKRFGEGAFKAPPHKCLKALKWMSDVDPEGTGELVDDVIYYKFSDKSVLIFDTKSKLFSKPN